MSRPNTQADFWARISIGDPGDCWPWTGAAHRQGYGALQWGGKKVSAHRLAYELTTGPIPHGMVVRHRCDNRPCCNPAHLEVGTPADNVRDRIERGRSAHNRVRGSQNGIAKLTEDQVAEIRRRRSAGDRRMDLAAEFNVTTMTIWRATSGSLWQHVGTEPAVECQAQRRCATHATPEEDS